MITDEEVGDFLEHFGIKGMRWGIRRDPQKLQASREAKAKEFDNIANWHQRSIDTIDSRIANGGYNRGYLLQRKAELVKQRDTAKNDAEAKRQGKMTSGQKKMVKGAAIVGGTVAAYAAYSTVQSGEAHRKITQGKMFLNKGDSPWKPNSKLADPKLSADQIMDQVVKPINPHYGLPGTKVNCRRATYAYEMRRRGHDVAATRTTNGRGQDVTGMYNATTPGVKPIPSRRLGIVRTLISEKRGAQKHGAETPFTTYATGLPSSFGTQSVPPRGIFSGLSKQPNGARGELGVQWAPGGGHSMAWEIVNGKPVVFDTQSGHRFSSQAQMDSHFKVGIADAGITRLDNIPLNENFLMRWLRDA